MDHGTVDRVARDPSGMLDLVLRLGETLAEGWELGRSASLPDRPARPRAVVVLGMGGSGIGGDVLRTIVADRATFPVVVVRDYALPAFVGRETLAFACSYSGDTEETLTAFRAARDRGASVVAITSGGALARLATEGGVPLVRVPGGLPPRAALGYLFTPMLAVLQRWDLVGPLDAEVREAAEVLGGIAREMGPGGDDDLARLLAERLDGAVPLVYSAAPTLEAAALRWKTQFNENTKILAYANTYPELNHNETVGWARTGQGVRFGVVVLRDRRDRERLAQRVEITRALALGGASSYDEVWTRGESLLARALSAILVGDLVSVYLAYRLGVDPTPVAVIDALKQRLTEVKG